MPRRRPEGSRHHHDHLACLPGNDREMLAYLAGRRLCAELDPLHILEMPHPDAVEIRLSDDERALRSTMTPTRWLACLLAGWSDESDGR